MVTETDLQADILPLGEMDATEEDVLPIDDVGVLILMLMLLSMMAMLQLMFLLLFLLQIH